MTPAHEVQHMYYAIFALTVALAVIMIREGFKKR